MCTRDCVSPNSLYKFPVTRLKLLARVNRSDEGPSHVKQSDRHPCGEVCGGGIKEHAKQGVLRSTVWSLDELCPTRCSVGVPCESRTRRHSKCQCGVPVPESAVIRTGLLMFNQ